MPDYQNRRAYDPLGSPEQQEVNVQVDSQAYHEIKTYNTVRDGIWEVYATLLEAHDAQTILVNAKQLSALLSRADTIWHEIEESAKVHAKSLKLRNQTFEYKGEMQDYENKIDRLISFVEETPALMDDLYEKDKDFTEYVNTKNLEKRRRFLKEKVKDIIKETDITWGRLASSIGFGMPLKLSEASDVFFRIKAALQTPHTEEDYQRYLRWTGKSRVKKIAYCFALYKVKKDAHLQIVIAGEFSQGKSASAMQLSKFDQKYTRRLLKIYKPAEYDPDHQRFSLEESVIISPRDPASKALKTPGRWRTYVIDEGYLFATTSTAGTRTARKLRDNIAQNRKMHPSNYWIYPNIFKMPSMFLEMMDVYIQKESVAVGDLIIPFRVMQLKEKFNKDKLEKYAKHPKYFSKLIRFHSGFICKARFSKPDTSEGKFWQRYLDKYEKYKIVDEGEDVKQKSRETFFKQVSKLIDKNVITIQTKADLQRLIYNLITKKAKMGESTAKVMANSLTDEYTNWQEEAITKTLTEQLSGSIMTDIKPMLDVSEQGAENGE